MNDELTKLDLNIANGNLTNDDAALILEIVLDTLVEVGNGTTDEELHKAADYLFALRDKWFNKKQIRIKTYNKYLDGGTIEISTWDDDKIYCYDHRIGTTTPGRLYDGYPEDDNSNIIEDSTLEYELKQAVDNREVEKL